MRKNAVNRTLREISGGVCAPEGFKANGIACGISSDLGKKDLALIAADKRCPSACVFSENAQQSMTANISKKHLKNGIARAILINSGIANIFLPNSEAIAERSCRLLAKASDIEVNETLLATTGCIGESLSIIPFEKGIPILVQGLTSSEVGSFSAAEAMMTLDAEPKQLAFEFDLGDFVCKIGAVYKGSAHVCPNMSTLLVVLTTDVNVSSKMLQKALSTAVRDTFNLLCLDGVSSPNDTVCIMANGKAGNYQIFCEDSEYEKFLYVLREVLGRICHRVIQDGIGENVRFTCKIFGAKSKQQARVFVKNVVCAQSVKQMILKGKVDMEAILYLLNESMREVHYMQMEVSLIADEERYVLFREGRKFDFKEDFSDRLNMSKEVTLSISLQEGNFASTAWGIINRNI